MRGRIGAIIITWLVTEKTRIQSAASTRLGPERGDTNLARRPGIADGPLRFAHVSHQPVEKPLQRGDLLRGEAAAEAPVEGGRGGAKGLEGGLAARGEFHQVDAAVLRVAAAGEEPPAL